MAVLPVGPVDEGVLEAIGCSLSKGFPDIDVFTLEDVLPMPDDAYNPRRRQYHSSRVLSHIESYARVAEWDRVLGVTEADLYVPGLNFVFGEARRSKGPAVISLFRLRPEFYGDPPNEKLFMQRASKEAVHEVGHTLDLGHCQDTRCVMFFSNSILDTDRKNLGFCERCRAKIVKYLERTEHGFWT